MWIVGKVGELRQVRNGKSAKPQNPPIGDDGNDGNDGNDESRRAFVHRPQSGRFVLIRYIFVYPEFLPEGVVRCSLYGVTVSSLLLFLLVAAVASGFFSLSSTLTDLYNAVLCTLQH